MTALLTALRMRLPPFVLDLVFPRRCAGCGRLGDWLCAACRGGLVPIGEPVCGRCGRAGVVGPSCSRCRVTLTAIDGIRAGYVLVGPARQAVHRLKYNGIAALAEPMGALLAAHLARQPLPSELLVPVPLHPRRLKARGYNQAARLAAHLGEQTGLPVVEALVRARETPPQVQVGTLAARRQNVAGAFAGAAALAAVRGRRVLVVDDVVTTGSTLDACATVLKAAGAATVWGLTFAREV